MLLSDSHNLSTSPALCYTAGTAWAIINRARVRDERGVKATFHHQIKTARGDTIENRLLSIRPIDGVRSHNSAQTALAPLSLSDSNREPRGGMGWAIADEGLPMTGEVLVQERAIYSTPARDTQWETVREAVRNTTGEGGGATHPRSCPQPPCTAHADAPASPPGRPSSRDRSPPGTSPPSCGSCEDNPATDAVRTRAVGSRARTQRKIDNMGLGPSPEGALGAVGARIRYWRLGSVRYRRKLPCSSEWVGYQRARG